VGELAPVFVVIIGLAIFELYSFVQEHYDGHFESAMINRPVMRLTTQRPVVQTDNGLEQTEREERVGERERRGLL